MTLIFENQWYYGLIPGKGGGVTSEHDVDQNNSIGEDEGPGCVCDNGGVE